MSEMGGMTLWFALLGGEIFLLLFVLLLVSWFRNNAAKRRDHKAAKDLIAKARDSKAEREKAIGDFLEQSMGLQGEALERHRVSMLREEMRLIQRFADTYRTRDAGFAAQFFVFVEGAIDPYHALSGGEGGGSTVAGSGDDSELETLRAENARLSEELSVTMDTMSRMLGEYSTMFSGGEPPTGASGARVMPDDEPAAAAEPVEEAAIVPEPEVAVAEEAVEAPPADASEPEAVAVDEPSPVEEVAEPVALEPDAEVAEAVSEEPTAARDGAHLDAEELDISEEPVDDIDALLNASAPVEDVQSVEEVVADEAAVEEQAATAATDDVDALAAGDLGDLEELFDSAEVSDLDAETEGSKSDDSIAI